MLAYVGSRWVAILKTTRLNLRISEARLAKLKRIAVQKEKTMTQMVEEWIDKLKEEKPS
jgi:hypothetical protein